ncbi:MAG TPA: DUF2877 domain-containing protein [Pseudonocardia sp.]|nr:DUF2877 domain-containing protein [Pseudonocardia sp.]
MATALDQGLGVREITGAGGRGRVLAVYRAAAYLRFPAGLFALTSAAAPPGPLHLRVAVLPVLRPGQPVGITGAALSGPDWTVGLDAPTWIGTLPTPSPPAPAVTDSGDSHPTPAGLAVLARAWGGRGPGLTPYGDDLLAGALLATRARRGPAAALELSALASAVSTTAVAAAFLRWAALGQCIEPAHAWLGAVADRDQAGMARAAARLSAIGASSGHGLLTGMTLAFSSRATTPTPSG